MTYPQALRIAILAISREQRHHVFMASLYGVGGMAGQKALVKWEKLEKAKQVLGQEKLL